MFFSTHNRALVRAVLAGVLAVAGVSACSRSDRADAGRDSVQTGIAATPSDTGIAATQSAGDTGTPSKDAPQPAEHAAPSAPNPSRPSASTRDSLTQDHGVSGYRAMARDTSAAADSATTGKAGERIVSTENSEQANSDTLAADDSTRIRPPEDSTEVLGRASTDTAAAVEPMARDTSTVLAQADTATGETQAADTAALSVSADTTTAEVESSDTLANGGHIRPTEDSTEVVGQVTTEPGVTDTLPSERDRIRPPEDSTELYGQTNGKRANVEADEAAVAAAPVEPTGNMATGADAVALMTRQGEACKVRTSRDAQWDLAASPATLNPCGTGTMTLPKIQTADK